jgi:heat shock protein HslJ
MFDLKYRSIITAVLVLAFSAAVSAQALEIPSGEWLLAELNGRNAEGSKAFIDIDVNAAKVSGNGGCNRLFGGVSGGNGKITFSRLGSTRMYCAGTSGAESEFLSALGRVNRYKENGNTLSLYAGTRVVMKFKAVRKLPPVEASEPDLESMKWMLETIGGKEVSKNGATAFISFDAAKHSAGGDTSCNAFGGTYSVNGDKLAITDVIATMRACVEDDRMTIEREFLDGLQKTNRYLISGEKLTLYHDRVELLSFHGVAK